MTGVRPLLTLSFTGCMSAMASTADLRSYGPPNVRFIDARIGARTKRAPGLRIGGTAAATSSANGVDVKKVAAYFEPFGFAHFGHERFLQWRRYWDKYLILHHNSTGLERPAS